MPEKASISGMDTKGKNLPQSNAGLSVKLRLFGIGATLDLRRGLTCWNLTHGVRSWCLRKMSRWAKVGGLTLPAMSTAAITFMAEKCGVLTNWPKSVSASEALHKTR